MGIASAKVVQMRAKAKSNLDYAECSRLSLTSRGRYKYWIDQEKAEFFTKKCNMLNLSKQGLDKAYFVSFCIEQFKKHRGIAGREAAELLYSADICDYLNDNYEILHTQSRQWLIEEIEERLKLAKNQ